ncbi:uncharacterized protein ACN2A1_001180 isoform 2-T2 [Glossina fuscipes fuscipes]
MKNVRFRRIMYRREVAVDETEKEIEVENVEENRRIMDTTGKTELDDGTIHTTPSSPVFILENTVAALIRQIEQLKDENAALKPNQGQEVEATADSGVPETEALKEVVAKLTPHDEIVQSHFDEVYTNRMTVYNRAEDRLLGYGSAPSAI